MHLTLSGGEPLAHPGFWQIASRGRQLGFVMRIKSNGHALRPEVVRRLREEVDPFMLEISLHGATSRTHDRQTRVPGSFDQLMQNLAVLKSMGMRVQLNCPLTRWVEKETGQMYELADKLGFPLTFDPHVSPRDDGDMTPRAIAASADGLRRLFRIQKQRGELVDRVCGSGQPTTLDPDRKHCGSGTVTLAVDPFGTVYPCVALRRSVGSLHAQSIADIWNGSGALMSVRRLTVEAARNVSMMGPDMSMGSFCPGFSDQIHGNPSHVHPDVPVVAQLKRECLED